MTMDEEESASIERILIMYNKSKNCSTIPKKTSDFHELFQAIFQASQKARRSLQDNVDLIEKIWPLIEKELNKLDDSLLESLDLEWNESILEGGTYQEIFRSKVLDLPVVQITGRGDRIIIGNYHYMNKVIQIPMKKSASLMSVAEIAHYLGLLYGKFTRKEFPEGLVKNFKDLKMNSCNNYISQSSVTEINLPHGFISDVRTVINNFVYENYIE
jgi:hypothetical protein